MQSYSHELSIPVVDSINMNTYVKNPLAEIDNSSGVRYLTDINPAGFLFQLEAPHVSSCDATKQSVCG